MLLFGLPPICVVYSQRPLFVKLHHAKREREREPESDRKLTACLVRHQRGSITMLTLVYKLDGAGRSEDSSERVRGFYVSYTQKIDRQAAARASIMRPEVGEREMEAETRWIEYKLCSELPGKLLQLQLQLKPLFCCFLLILGPKSRGGSI